jgi:hypothetical protein
MPNLYADSGVLWQSLQAIDEVFLRRLSYDNESKRDELSQGYYDHSGCILDGFVVAMDGLDVQTYAPFLTVVECPKYYHFCNSVFVVIVLAGEMSTGIFFVLCLIWSQWKYK